jgi:uncharacterized phage protein (TIGR01671 family)
MREVRYRAWVDEMVEALVIDWRGGTILDRPGIMDQRNDIWYFEDYPDMLEQFTGLRDKNGVEIYENDRVRYGRTIRGRDVFFESEVIWKNGFVLKLNKTVLVDHYVILCHRNIEVIGNVHE